MLYVILVHVCIVYVMPEKGPYIGNKLYSIIEIMSLFHYVTSLIVLCSRSKNTSSCEI